ncbi:MAG: sensor histidine kinase [Agriterribacter sp.]
MQPLMFYQKVFHIKKSGICALHILAWLTYTTYIYLTNYVANDRLHFIPTLLFLLPYYTTFYVVLFFLNIPSKHKIAWGISVFFIVFIIMSSVSYLLIYWTLPIIGVTLYSSSEMNSFIQGAVLGYVQFFAYALLYYYFSSTLKKERELRLLHEENTKIEQQKVKQELDNVLLREKQMQVNQEKLAFEYAFLQSQINPHFLYNTLNVLFSQALKISPELAGNISKMSEIMRYSMESVEYKIPLVSIQKELDHLQILIDINVMRFGNGTFIDFRQEGQSEGQLIPPLSFITVIENAFKYGEIKDSANPLCIIIKLRPGHVYFYCRNKKKKNKTPLPSHNIGLKNLRYRLNTIFNDRYHLDIIDEEEFYTLELTITSI